MGVATFIDGKPQTNLRGLLFLALSGTAHVLTTAGTSDAGGGFTSGTITQGSAIPCRIDPLSGTESEVAGQITDRSTHVVTIPADVVVEGIDKLAISGVGNFEILAVRERTRALYQVLEVTAAS